MQIWVQGGFREGIDNAMNGAVTNLVCEGEMCHCKLILKENNLKACL